ncbi:MAG TPA: O-linked N-acetylglucosamine transferase, SPINDLY family protein, partial [Allocoleopsis sp.]
NPRSTRSLRNQLAQIAQPHLQSVLQVESTQYRDATLRRKPQSISTRPPRIGYLAGSLRKHSVGWLCRWLLKHHDRNQFDIHLYSSRHSTDFIQQQFMQDYGDRFHAVPSTVADIADRISADEIDILIELDSLTSLGGCGVVALKPAPIQVHWLGYDSSGIPAVDYFIADPYVLPDDAQEYYSETIWRLPQTYIAVDGFEVHLPSLRRDQLGIPNDAVVYLSSQTGMKRNVDNARLQMKILKEVPNSYFLVKSFRAIPEFIETFFTELAEEEGVSPDRLRFLPDVPSEFTHRANLALADVVLDTYPYNGATTSLEALWMGLPIVTRVGEQFAARNSYTMMMNVGITEGIAWNDQEYLEWGVRLGQNAALREDIFYRLRQSRHSSPLWNGQQFAREMEHA